MSYAPVETAKLNTSSPQTTTEAKKSNFEDLRTQTLASLLEMYVEEKRDFPAAQNLIEENQSDAQNQMLIKLYQAKILSRSLQFDEALHLLEKIDNPDLDLIKACVLIANGSRSDTEQFLHHIVDQNPDPSAKAKALALLNAYQSFDTHRDADTSYLWTLFAQKLGELGEWEISHYLSEKATEARPEYRDAWIIKGYTELKLGKLPQAEQSLLSAYALDPGNTNVQYLLGSTYFQLEKPELSTQYLLYAKQNDQLHLQDILKKLAENAIKTEDFALAAHYLEEALTTETDKAPLFSRLVWLYLEKLQQPEQARLYAQKRLDLFPNDSESYQLMSWVYTKQDQLEKAMEFLEEAKTKERMN